ncbi:hypothetical protein PFISCL1PPCAC_25631, partial [Pristionchus fissidentatus]
MTGKHGCKRHNVKRGWGRGRRLEVRDQRPGIKDHDAEETIEDRRWGSRLFIPFIAVCFLLYCPFGVDDEPPGPPTPMPWMGVPPRPGPEPDWEETEFVGERPGCCGCALLSLRGVPWVDPPLVVVPAPPGIPPPAPIRSARASRSRCVWPEVPAPSFVPIRSRTRCRVVSSETASSSPSRGQSALFPPASSMPAFDSNSTNERPFCKTWTRAPVGTSRLSASLGSICDSFEKRNAVCCMP